LFKDDAPEAASVVPLAFPLIAGAGSLTSILSLRAEFHTINILIAIILNMIFVYAVLKSSQKIEKFIGKAGIGVIRKVFGIVLLAISVKLFTANIKDLL
jgi:multiple antibiotic resistance protein